MLFSQITGDDLSGLVEIDDRGIHQEIWDELARGELNEPERKIIDVVVDGLKRFRPSVVNEITVLARAVFPLLTLAEVDGVEAQANVPLVAQIGDVELAGNADGALGTPFEGEIRSPFLIVVEAKRGVEGHNPMIQLYAELLAAALLNARRERQTRQRIYGAYTIGANWTFVRGDIDGLEGTRPTFTIVSSLELTTRLEAAVIAKILKSIVSQHQRTMREAPTRA